MPLASGARLGPYEVIAAIGAGGMGEVYKARDTRLDRTVAVKVLPPALAEDPEFRHRFDREARTISQLSHPHICTLYDVGEGFLVMEYLEGETLADRLARGELPVNEAVRIAMQIADALAKAHNAGIVHRDLKPGNVMLTRSGAKLLDFGLAKPGVTHGFQSRAAGMTLASTPTMTTPPNLTGQGAVLGTLQYMAPEVLEGAEADARSDIFAFGCVFYEMLTGRKAFQGKSQVSLIGSILKDNPAPIAARPDLPPALIWLVGRCLAKNPDDRRQTAAGLVSQLEWVAEGGGAPTASVVQRRMSARGFVLVAAAAVALVGLTAASMWWYLAPPASSPRTTRFVISLPAGETIPTLTGSRNVVISPDGSHIVYLTRQGAGAALWVRPLAQLEPTRLIASALNLGAPAISPDGKWVAFSENSNIQKISITGGPPVMVAQGAGGVAAVGIDWVDNNTLVFATADPTTGLQMVSADGGTPTVLTKPNRTEGEEDHAFPSALPGGRAILFTIIAQPGGNHQVAVLDVASGSRKTLVRGGSAATFVPTGHLVYAEAGGLRAVRFDPVRLQLVGDPMPVIQTVAVGVGGAADFAISPTGTLVYVAGGGAGASEDRAAVWVDRQGTERPIDGLPQRAFLMARISPDGSRIAFDVRDQAYDIWSWDIRYRTLTPVTIDAAQDMFPVWVDNRRIVFASSRAGSPALYLQAADGSGAAEKLAAAAGNLLPLSVSPDGKQLVFRDNDGRRAGPDLGLLSLETRTTSVLLGADKYAEDNASISADGRWIAYESTESGRREVYVRPFPGVGAERIPISSTGGSKPLFAPNGRELFYVDSSSGYLVAVPVKTAGAFTRAEPIRLFRTAPYFFTQARNYDVTGDGQRFLMLKGPSSDSGDRTPTPINVVVDWFEELKQRAPK